VKTNENIFLGVKTVQLTDYNDKKKKKKQIITQTENLKYSKERKNGFGYHYQMPT
jgi:hypothetical protein